jgi:hypothetical protein
MSCFSANKAAQRVGDLLENDLGHLHQMSKAISDHTSRIKNKQQQAFSHSKIEVKLDNKDIEAIIKQVQVKTKRVMSKWPYDAISKSDSAETERDVNRLQTLVQVERKEHTKLLTYHEEQKLKMLNNKMFLTKYLMLLWISLSLHLTKTSNL